MFADVWDTWEVTRLPHMGPNDSTDLLPEGSRPELLADELDDLERLPKTGSVCCVPLC